MLFRKTGAVDYLVVGLGNPGLSYEGTRHNAGCSALGVLAKDCKVELTKRQFHAMTATVNLGDKKVLLLYPQTFMNNSGQAVQEAMAFYKLTPDKLLVMSDDISLDVGVIRIRKKGSDGGQKGLRSIIEHIGSEDFARVRIGIGAKPHPAYDLAEWVLSKFKKDELPLMEDAFARAAEAARMIAAGDIEEATNRYSH